MKKGLGMWIMSKMVMLIFLFSLLVLMTLFLRVYTDKVVSDTAKTQTIIWAESANGALSFASASDQLTLPNIIRIENAARQYTAVIQKIETTSSAGPSKRIVFLYSWGDHSDADEIDEFAAATSVSVPSQITLIKFFNGDSFGSFVEESGDLLVQASQHGTLIFVRNREVFCIGVVDRNIPVELLKTAGTNLRGVCVT